MTENSTPVYDLDCMRCHKKIPEVYAKYSNHCDDCLPLVIAKCNSAREEIDRIRKEVDDFSRGLRDD